MKQTPEQKAKMIERGIRLAWASLETHLPLAYGKPTKAQGNTFFHKKTVKDYVEIIDILTKLY